MENKELESKIKESIKEINNLREDLDSAWENFIDKKELYLLNKASEMEVEEVRNKYEEIGNKYWKKLRDVVNGKHGIRR